MANTEKNETPGDVEAGNRQTPAADPPAPPTVLEQARLGNLDLFQTELESGDHPLDFKAGSAVYFNRTPLHLAAMEGHEEIVEFILSRPEISREVVNAKDGFGYTPLHLAVRHSHYSVVELLTTSSLVLPDRFLAATNEPDDLGQYFGGCTPLHLAAMRGSITTAKLLLRQPRQVEFEYDPVNILAMTWHNLTPLDLARMNNFRNLGDFLEASDLNWLLQEREKCAISVNAILVGAALVVAATFATWMQPPGGIPAPDSAASGVSSSSLRSDRMSNSTFYLFVTFAFEFSLLSLVLGIMATFRFPKASLRHDLSNLRRALNLARTCLVVALVSLIIAFYAATAVVYHKVASKQSELYKVVYALPLIICMVVLGVFLALRKPVYPD